MATPPTFTTGQVLTAAQMNTIGLFKVGGGSFTAATSVDITGFSSDYKTYRLVYFARRTDTAGTANASFQVRSSSTAQGSGYYYAGGYANYLGATGSLVAGNNQTTGWYPAADSFAAQSLHTFDIQLDQASSVSWQGTGYFTGSAFVFTYGGAVTTSLTIDRWRVSYSTGSVTGGWRLYGYREP